MNDREMAHYTLRIKTDSGYEALSSGRCDARQFSLAYGVLIGTVKPEIEEQHAEMLEALTLLDAAYDESVTLPCSGVSDKELARRWGLARAAIAKARGAA